MANKIILITGANFGIGYETVKCFLQSKNQYHILLGCRSPVKGNDAREKLLKEVPNTSSTIEVLEVDLNSDSSIEKAYESIKTNHKRLDTLINNAGAAFDKDHKDGTLTLRDSFNKAYDVNVSGTHVLTYTLVPLLLLSSHPRLIFIAGLSQITLAAESYFPTPPQPAGWPKTIDFETIGYRCSKTAMNMLMLDWNHKLKADGVKVWSVSPGFCNTGLGGVGEDMMVAMGAVHPSEGGRRIVSVAEGERDADVGKAVDKEGLLPW